MARYPEALDWIRNNEDSNHIKNFIDGDDSDITPTMSLIMDLWIKDANTFRNDLKKVIRESRRLQYHGH